LMRFFLWRSYGADRSFSTGGYKDLAPTEQDPVHSTPAALTRLRAD
jgi:hypothetical protein